MLILLSVALLFMFLVFIHFAKVWDQKYRSLNLKLHEATALLGEAQAKVFEEQEKNKVVVSQKKSSETRLGQMTEHLVPFLDGFPYDPKDCHFLGMPIDYLVFDFDAGEITFVEIKTGNARESDRQKKIKNIIKTGKVYYSKIRLNEKGMKIQEEKNND